MKAIRFLKWAYVMQLKNGSFSAADMASAAGISYGYAFSLLKNMLKSGYVKKVAEKSLLGSGRKPGLRGPPPARYVLTKKGRSFITVVLAGGAFDILHPGHVAFLTDAKMHGNCLVVVVARDSTVRERKGRVPFNNENDRLVMVSSLKPVDLAILGSEDGFEKTMEKVKPDIVFLGYDQDGDAPEIRRFLTKTGGKIRISKKRLPEYSTSRIITAIRSGNSRA